MAVANSGWANRIRPPCGAITLASIAGPRSVGRPERRLEQPGRGLGAHGRDQQGLPHRLGQRAQPVGEQRLEVAGDRQGAAVLELPAVLPQRAPDLERVERVAAGGLVQLPQRRPGERRAEAAAEQLVQRAQAERAETEPVHVPGERPFQLERRPSAPVAPSRHQQADRLVPEPLRREPDQVRRRRVEPLDVVERERHGVLPREHPQRGQEREGDRPAFRRALGLVGEQHGDLERRALRRRQPREHAVEHPAEKIGEPGERELLVRLGRPRRDHRVRPRRRLLDRVQPQRRLADPGLALEHERRGGPRPAREEPADRGEFLLAAEDVRRRRGRGRHPGGS
jgi:hypothetical protein